ncbi:MutS-related protein [Nocardia callitridis]|uniref:DNA mismatch repair protein MutS n=1 Tax=Nocardia callitridis TaxID=648753 RepID=A0ABP9K5D4_9NOCA
MKRFVSILWDSGNPSDTASAPSDSIIDLNLEQVFVLAGATKHKAAHHRPLRDVSLVRYRQQVFNDLQDEAVSRAFETFVAGMSSVRQHLERARKLTNPRQSDRWQLDAETLYCRTVLDLHAALRELPLSGEGLRQWRDWLAEYVDGPNFGGLLADEAHVRAALDEVRYTVHVNGRHLVIDRYAGQSDYSDVIAAAFARFGVDDDADRQRFFDPWPDMNVVEEQVIALVADQQPGPFQQLEGHARHYREFIDPVLGRFDAELHFYLDYLWMVREFDKHGLAFCLPEVTEGFAGMYAEGAYDAALVPKLIKSKVSVVRNDFRLEGAERAIVVTGPNQGGKSTFARMFGGLAYLAALGCPVPATRARLPLPDNIFTHFVREDDISDAEGGLARELARLHDILADITASSLVVLNESLSTTTVSDATRLGGEVLRRIVERGAVAVYVTFLEELAELGPEVVSMVAGVDSADDAIRTFRVERRLPDGLAHAAVVAERHGLTYDAIRARVR